MNSNQNPQAIATGQDNCDLESRTPEPVDPVAARLRAINHQRVREDIETGKLLFFQKQSCKRLKDFKVWLDSYGFAYQSACKYLKLYQTFASFPLEQISGVDINTLSTLCQPKYRALLPLLRSLPKWVDVKIVELMQQFWSEQKAEREQQKTQKPPQEKNAGWRQVPGGGRAFKLPLLHDEETGMRIVQIQKEKNLTVHQVIKEAIALLFSLLKSPTLIRRARYILYAPGCEQYTYKTKIWQPAPFELPRNKILKQPQ